MQISWLEESPIIIVNTKAEIVCKNNFAKSYLALIKKVEQEDIINREWFETHIVSCNNLNEHKNLKLVNCYEDNVKCSVAILNTGEENLYVIGLFPNSKRYILASALIANNESIFLTLMERSNEAIIILDNENCCIFINKAAENMIGYDLDELSKSSFHRLVHNKTEAGDNLEEEDCELCNRNSKTQWLMQGKTYLYCKEKRVPIQYRKIDIVRDENRIGSLLSFSDISKSQLIEAELVRSKEALVETQTMAHLGSWDWNIIDNSLFWSDEIYRIFGLTPNTFGATYNAFLESIHESDRQSVIDAVNEAVANPHAKYEICHRVVRPNKEIRWVKEIGKVFRNNTGNPIRMIGMVQDITETKDYQDRIKALNDNLENRVQQRTSELEQTNKKLNQSLSELKKTQEKLIESEKMSSLSGLIAGVAHEINTPIGIGFTASTYLTELLHSYQEKHNIDSMDDDMRTLFSSLLDSSSLIEKNMQRAADMVRNFKQISSDHVYDEPRNIDLKSYLLDIVQSLSPKLKKTNFAIAVSCDENLEIFLSPGALYQIISNLVLNSIIHGFEGREKGNVNIEVYREANDIILEYSDDGVGIHKNNETKVFEPFFTTKRNRGGTGLGLNIVYNLVTSTLKGEINLSKNNANGTIFIIRFPYFTVSNTQKALSN